MSARLCLFPGVSLPTQKWGNVQAGTLASASTIALLGQVVISGAVDQANWPGYPALKACLADADCVFTNLESVVNAPRPGTLTRAKLTLHAADPSALRSLADLNINLFGIANNHAFDLHADGMLNTMEALRSAGIPFAGVGENSAAATASAYAVSRNASASGGTITAAVAFATGMLRPGAAADVDRMGVNALRRLPNGLADPDDVARILGSIRTAKACANVVIACHHNHDRGAGGDAVPDWQRLLAYQCIDAGADVFVSHGVPVLQGVEVYRSAPLFFGLGNFMFQVQKAIGAYEKGSWEGVIALCTFENRRCRAVRLRPIILNEVGPNGGAKPSERGMPRLAPPLQANAVLDYLRVRSAELGTTIDLIKNQGVLNFS